jgi:membrane-bound lytic murein transglycosylase D
MKKRMLSTLMIMVTALGVTATSDSLKTDGLTMPDEEVNRMDSMLQAMYNANPALMFHEKEYLRNGYTPTDTPAVSPEEVKERIARINTPIPLTYNDNVQAFIDLYTLRRRDKVSNMLTIGQDYFPMIEEELDRRGMPLELKYVAVIESALNTHAVSKAGATGLWQMMYGTGKLMGLQINTYVDERRDPYLATQAGIAYLEKLYGIYDDWLLAIAAYNCGPGNVNKAIRRSGGGEKTFWEIWKYLPRETRAYVPIFIAATYTFEYHKELNILPAEFGYSYKMLDTVMITRKMTLDQVSPFVGLSAEEIKVHNPALKTSTIPGSPTPFPLRLPSDAVAMWISNQDSCYALLDKPAEKNEPALAVKETPAAKPVATSGNANESLVRYTVKKGDNLGYISEWFDCGVSELKRWNGMSSTRIYAGQKLKIYVPSDKKDHYASINTMSFAQKQDLSDVQMVQGGQQEGKKEVIYYTIKPGDTLWSIAKRYPENTIEGLQEMNSLSHNATLKVGEKIKIVQ